MNNKIIPDGCAPSKLDIMNKMCVLAQQHAQLHITAIHSEWELNQVKNLRLRVYHKNLPYMLSQMSESGEDEYDSHSFIFAARYEDVVVASVRLTPHPFETHKYIDQQRLTNFLGAGCQADYLEWSRLLVDTSCKVKGVANVLATYAGLYVMANTNYTHYFGYTRPHVKRLLSRFQFDANTMPFTIPSRGEHEYLLIKGNFINDFYHLDTMNVGNNTSLLSRITKKLQER